MNFKILIYFFLKYCNKYMNFIYNSKLSFGSIFQYDENIVTKSETDKDIINNTTQNDKEEKKSNEEDDCNTEETDSPDSEEDERSELEKDIDSDPFFFT